MGPSSDDDDARAFEEAMRGARRLPREKAGHPDGAAGPPDEAGARSRPAPSRASRAPFEIEQGAETIAGRALDVSTRVLRDLRAGAHPIEARLDLHGRTQADASGQVGRFVAAARGRGLRGVLVIHGRGRNSGAGGPVLRPVVWEWLASAAAARAGVMAFVSARPSDGGPGATLVLLRR